MPPALWRHETSVEETNMSTWPQRASLDLCVSRTILILTLYQISSQGYLLPTATPYFIPLPKRLSAKNPTELIIVPVFKLHGIPKHIVYNRGPFCRLVGAAPNLFSEFHSSATARQKTAEKNCPGWSTPITPKFHHLLVCIPSSDAWGINRPCFCLRRLAFHLPKVSAIIAERSGCKLQ